MIQCSCRCFCFCCYLCARLRLMWWNPHGEMMCSVEGWRSRGEEGSPCQGLVEPHTCSGPVPLSISTETVQTPLSSHYPPQCSSPLPLCCDLYSYGCLSLRRFHVSYHTFDLSAACWSIKVLPVWVVRASGLSIVRGRKNSSNFTALTQTSPSPGVYSITWRGFLTPGANICLKVAFWLVLKDKS